MAFAPRTVKHTARRLLLALIAYGVYPLFAPDGRCIYRNAGFARAFLLFLMLRASYLAERHEWVPERILRDNGRWRYAYGKYD
jgi:hypothetical protein